MLANQQTCACASNLGDASQRYLFLKIFSVAYLDQYVVLCCFTPLGLCSTASSLLNYLCFSATLTVVTMHLCHRHLLLELDQLLSDIHVLLVKNSYWMDSSALILKTMGLKGYKV